MRVHQAGDEHVIGALVNGAGIESFLGLLAGQELQDTTPVNGHCS